MDLFAFSLYADGSPYHQSDQITISARKWRNYYADHDESGRPLFVNLGGPVARLRPEASFRDDECRIPEWIWLSLGCPDIGTPLTLTPCDLPDAGTLTLRPRQQTTGDLVALLTEALSGTTGPSWAVLNTGAELPLACGVFDILRIQDLTGEDVSAACILNLDVNLEFESTLTERPPTPCPSLDDFNSMIDFPTPGTFTPFSGVGRRLGGDGLHRPSSRSLKPRSVPSESSPP